MNALKTITNSHPPDFPDTAVYGHIRSLEPQPRPEP
jgi:hypothetical protein